MLMQARSPGGMHRPGLQKQGARDHKLPHVMQIGWAQIALADGGRRADLLGAFDWHVAFHGTAAKSLPKILSTGYNINYII